jgi:PIN domain nuclease of toxin-antitoxin system
MILLDSCVLLWLTSDPSCLSSAAAMVLQEERTPVFVSAISTFEIGQKAARKRIILSMPVCEWMNELLQYYGFRELAITSAIAGRATLLPSIHSDPFDRLLVSTAIEHHLTLVTPDRTIRQYPGVKTLW